jgi:hypothetical protein
VATGQPSLYADFSGGVNLQSGPYLLAENQCRDCRNVRSFRDGSIEKRNGFTTVADSTDFTALDGAAHTLFPVNLPTKSLLIVGKQAAASNDRIIKSTTAGIPTTLKSGLTQGKRWEFVQGPVGDPSGTPQGPIYGMNGSDTPQQWNGSAAATTNWTATTGTVPTGTTLLYYHLDKLWASGDPNYPGRVWSTGVNVTTGLPDPLNWDTDYIDDVEPEDGEEITAFGEVGPYLLVFKSHKTYVLSDPAGRAYRQVSSTIGCTAARSVVQTSKGTLFLSEDLGVCVTDGTNITQLSDNIQPLLKDAIETSGLSFKNAAATYHQNSYWLSLPYQDSANDITLEYNLVTGAWWIHTCNANQWALLDPVGLPTLYSINAQSLLLEAALVENVYADGGTAFESYWTGPFWPWGQPHLNKRVSQIRVDGIGAWEMYAATSFDTTYDLLEPKIWETATGGTEFGGTGDFGDLAADGTIFAPAGAVNQRRYWTPIQGWGRAWSLKVFNNDPYELQLYSMAAFVRGRSD